MSDSRERQTSELLALLDGELTEPIAIDALLARPGARAELAELTRIRRSLSGIPDIIPDAAVWERIQQMHSELNEPDVLIPMRNLASVWNELFIEEQCRLAQLLIERVIIADGGLEIFWHDQGWPALIRELQPGTLAAELQAAEDAP